MVAAHGAESLEALDVRDADTGEVTRLPSGGLFSFIGEGSTVIAFVHQHLRDGDGGP